MHVGMSEVAINVLIMRYYNRLTQTLKKACPLCNCLGRPKAQVAKTASSLSRASIVHGRAYIGKEGEIQDCGSLRKLQDRVGHYYNNYITR